MKKLIQMEGYGYIKNAQHLMVEQQQYTPKRDNRPEEDFDRFEDEYEKGYGR